MIDPLDIALPPGVFSVATKASKSANWSESNLVRWIEGRLCPIGGWSKLNYSLAFATPLKAIHRWTTQNNVNVIGYLCERHIYVDYGSGLVDVTPVGGVAAPNTNKPGGYGTFKYNDGLYDTARPQRTNTTRVAAMYSIDNWGQNMLVMTSSDGRLLQWDPLNPTSPCEVVAGSPLTNRCFVVTPQRHVILFGAGGVYNKMWWCDEEDITDWTVADIASKAGDFNFQPASPIVSVCRSGADIVMFTSNNDAFVISYLGLPYIYTAVKFQCDAVPMSPTSLIDTPLGCVWTSTNGFWYFTGGSAVPLACTVWDWVDKTMSATMSRVTATFVSVPSFSEVYFFFASTPSSGNDRYVVWNYKNQWWANGKMKRACGIKSMYAGFPLMSDGQYVYQHESGNAYDLLSGEELPYAKTHVINTAGGALMSSIGRMIPDVGGDTSGLEFQLEYQVMRSGGNIAMASAPKAVVGGIVGFRETGRDFQLVARQNVNAVKDWTMGDTILEKITRGRL